MNKYSCRRVQIVIDLVQLREWDAYDIGEILQSLPEDTKVVSFGSELNCGQLIILIENDQFKEAKEAEMYPKLYPKEDKDGFLVVDYSNVLEVQSDASLSVIIDENLGDETVILSGNRMFKSTWDENTCSNATLWHRVYGAYYNPINDKQLEIKTTCDHTWAHYDSGFSQYDYCTKCDEKKND